MSRGPSHSLAGPHGNELTEINPMNVHTPDDFSCPACRSLLVTRAEYEGIVERTLLRFVDICPFVCHVCDMRFYLFVATSSFRRPEAIQAWDDAQRSKSILSSN